MMSPLPLLFPDAPLREVALPFAPQTISLLLLKDATALAEGDTEYPNGDIYWGELWPAGLACAAGVLAGEIVWQRGSAPILEIGSGAGVVSIAAALAMKLGLAPRTPIIATDREPRALELIKANALRNGVAEFVSTEQLDWQRKYSRQHPLIFAADCLYRPDAGRQLATFLRQALTDDGRALVIDPERWSARHFSLHAQQAGLAVKTFRRVAPFAGAHGPVGKPAGPAFYTERAIDCVFYELNIAEKT